MLPLFHDQVYCFARPELEGLTAIGQSNSDDRLRGPLDPALAGAATLRPS